MSVLIYLRNCWTRNRVSCRFRFQSVSQTRDRSQYSTWTDSFLCLLSRAKGGLKRAVLQVLFLEIILWFKALAAGEFVWTLWDWEVWKVSSCSARVLRWPLYVEFVYWFIARSSFGNSSSVSFFSKLMTEAITCLRLKAVKAVVERWQLIGKTPPVLGWWSVLMNYLTAV